jgi:FMN-dependent NADH-azoreductase
VARGNSYPDAAGGGASDVLRHPANHRNPMSKKGDHALSAANFFRQLMIHNITEKRQIMPHLLHIDSSITGEQSTSRRLSARAARRWLAAHPGGTITFRDLAAHPIPHFDAVTGLARMVPPEKRSRAEHLSFALSVELINEIKQADTVLLGVPLYNYGPPSTIKAWVDHLIAPGVSVDAQTNAGLLGDTEFIVLAARGGGYGPGTPREGWDHAEPWLRHALSTTGLEPRFITAELTVASSNPAMADLIPLAAESLVQAETAIDELWSDLHCAA